MTNAENILQELKELNSSLPQLVGNQNVFSVPVHYFEELPIHILLKVQHTTDYEIEVPSLYFDNLSASILQKIKNSIPDVHNEVEEELSEISPLLVGMPKVNPYTLQEGYFEHLPEKIISVVQEVKETPVVQMRKMPAIVRYLVAAGFVGLVGFSLFSMFNNRNNNPGVKSTVMAKASSIIAEDSFDAELATLSASDIETYLQKTGHDPDAAVAASAINDVNLPDELDYLLNENTLNDFLNKKSIAN